MKSLQTIRQEIFSDITHVPNVLGGKHFYSLDGLRAVSILFVILSHILNFRLGLSTQITIIEGGLGVQIFFIISGFLITSLLLKEKVNTGDISLKKFYLRRVLRIFPVAYLFILIIYLLDLAFQLNITRPDFFSALFYYKNFSEGSWYLGHYWSLAVEEQFYLIFPFLLAYLPLKRYIQCCICILLLSPALLYIDYHTSSYANIFCKFIYQYDTLIIGSLTSVLIFKGLINIDLLKPSIWCNYFFLILGIIITYHFNLPLKLNLYINSIFIAILLVKSIHKNDGWFFKFLNNRVVVYLGLLSYSMYIWQQLFTAGQPWSKSFTFGNSVFLNLMALIFISFVSYNFYEKPFLALKERFK